MSLPNNKSYSDIVYDSILSLKERTGTSLPSLKSKIAEDYPDLVIKKVNIEFI